MLCRRTRSQPTVTTSGYLFLSPEWVREVASAVQVAQRRDGYFRKLASAFTMKFACLVRSLPSGLRERYGAGDTVVIVVHLRKGSAEKVDVGGELPPHRVNLIVESDYDLAKRIVLGQASAAGSFLSGKVRVRPVDGRPRPSAISTSLVTASEVVKIARQVPTTF